MDKIIDQKLSMQFKEEIDININDLFILDFNNLKIYLTTLLKNQNEMYQKIKDLENKLKEQETKTNKDYTQIEERVKIIEKDNILQKEKEKEKELKENNKIENIKNITPSTSDLEILKLKQNLDKQNDIKNLNKKDNNINSDNSKNKKKIHKYKKKEVKEKEEEENENNNTIPEEESIKSENENENELKSNNYNETDYNRNKYPRKSEDPYKTISTKDNNFEKVDNLVTKYNLMKSNIDEIKKRLLGIEKKNRSIERGSKLLSLKSFDSNTIEDLQYLKIAIKDLQNRDNEINKENEIIQKDLEEIKVKIKDFDIYEIFKDLKLDEGSIDAAKALVLTLEQKVFKKTSLIDDKIKRLEDGINKMEVENKTTKNMAEIMKLTSEDIKRMIKNLEELENKNAVDNLNMLNDINDFKNKYTKKNINIDKKIEDINKNTNDLFDKIKHLSDIEKRFAEIEKKINEQKSKKIDDDLVNSLQFKKLKYEFNETIKELRKKDIDLEKQIELLKTRPEIGQMREDIKKLQYDLSLKINYKDLLELKDKLNIQSISINNIRDNMDRISEIANKNKNDMGFVLKRVEALSAAQVSTRTVLDELIKKQQEFIFDSSKYLEIVTFNKFISSIQKEKEKGEQNIKEINKLLNNMTDIIKTKASSEDMKIFEEIINNKLEELKLFTIKRFTDKIENNKNIKFLDSQIRHIIDVYIKRLNKPESWLIAKKPLGGYACASCESYLGELKKSQDYMPWNKYPNRERDQNFRLGNGFSKMLNVLNSDLKNQIDAIKDKDSNNDNLCESDNEKIESKENNLYKKRLSKNLSCNNINYSNINTRNDIKKYILPKISLNKGEELKENLSMDMGEGQIGTTNDMADGDLYNESEKLKNNNENNEEQPHVVKVYRKNKLNTSEINKKS